MKLACVIGARPNYMKMAPILKAIKDRQSAGRLSGLMPILVHTGQHYDHNMNDAFFHDLGLPPPDEFLGVGGGSHGQQTAKVMAAFDEVCERHRFDAVLVVGDVNSTLACALVGAKRLMKVIHVEAGLRSNDRSMPEEINRVLTDQISDLLLITSEDAVANLIREGVGHEKIRFVGNPMIDSLETALSKMPPRSTWLNRVAEGTGSTEYVVVTLHRPSNVDDVRNLSPILDAVIEVGKRAPVFFPVHPRTAKAMSDAGILLPPVLPDQPVGRGAFALPPLGYRDFLDLMRGATLVITDSGGIQEETTALGVPCATVRENTERPITVTVGTNELVGCSTGGIVDAADRALRGIWKRGTRPPLWDGLSAFRIADSIGELES